MSEDEKQLDTYSFFYYIHGLGCSNKSADYYVNLAAEWTKLLGVPTEILCNSSYASALVDVSRSYCRYELPTNSFVLECIKKIKEKLDKYLYVYVIGHSYGGSVANRVAEYFSKNVHLNNNLLQIATMGTIYVSPPSVRITVSIVNYMINGDVALKCNGCAQTKKNCENMLWLSSAKHKVKQSFFGTRQEWDIHNSYGNLIFNLIANKDSISNLRATDEILTWSELKYD